MTLEYATAIQSVWVIGLAFVKDACNSVELGSVCRSMNRFWGSIGGQGTGRDNEQTLETA